MSATKRFRAGVLFGDEVKELLDYAKANQFALPAINCIGTNSVNATRAAARVLHFGLLGA
jgi:fructose-bisphosphate aldolase class II